MKLIGLIVVLVGLCWVVVYNISKQIRLHKLDKEIDEINNFHGEKEEEQ